MVFFRGLQTTYCSVLCGADFRRCRSYNASAMMSIILCVKLCMTGLSAAYVDRLGRGLSCFGGMRALWQV